MNNVQAAVCSNNSMKDDPLGFIEKICMYKLSYKYKRTSQIICYTFFGLIELNLLFMLEFAITRNTALLKRFLVTVICQQPACLMFAIRPYFLKYLSTVQDFYFEYYASLETPDEGFNRTVRSKVLATKIVCSFLLLLFIFIQVSFVAVNHLHIERSTMYHFQYVLLFREFYQVYLLLVILTYASAAASAYIVVYPVIAAVYIIVHLQLQFQYLNHYLDRKVKKLEIGEGESYQEAIRERLLFCVKHHVVLKSAHKYQLTKLANMPKLALSTTGLIVCIACFYHLYNRMDPLFDPLMVMVIFHIIIQTVIASIYGQLLINESEGFYGILNDSPWMYWNRNNQNMLLMMLVNAREPFKITLFGLVTLNYAMIVSAARLCYSFTTVAIKI